MQRQRGSWGMAAAAVMVLVAAFGATHQIYEAWWPLISCSDDVIGTEESMTKKECQALSALYDANVRVKYPASRPEWNGFVPRPMRDWASEPNPCLWKATVCRSGHLTELSIVGDNSTTYDFISYLKIPPEIGDLSHLDRLTIETGGVETLPSELAQLTDLRVLQFRGVVRGGDSVTAAIGPLTGLEELSLLIEATDSFPEGLLSELKKMPHLSRLALATSGGFPPELLEMTELTSLHLLGPGTAELSKNTGNGVSDLPSGIERLNKLIDLSLSGNALTTLPPEISSLSRLTSLDISRNEFTALPTGLDELPNLRSLNLAGNQLGEIPAEIVELEQLETLDVSFNELDAVPAAIGQMASLSNLDLGGNGLTTVPAVVFELNPSRLDLSDNRLTEFPLAPGQLSNVSELDLGDNSLSKFPADLVLLPNLSKLNLRSNRMSELPAAVGDLSHLTHLDLSGNYTLYDVDALIPFVQQPGFEDRLDLSRTCASSTEPRLQKLADQTRDLLDCPDAAKRSD